MWEALSLAAVVALAGVWLYWRGRVRRLEDDLARARKESAELRGQRERGQAELNTRQEALLNSITEGILLLDGEGRILTGNEALIQMFGVGRALQGKTLLETFRLHALVEFVGDITLTGQPREMELAVPGLQQRFFEVNGSMSRHAGGQGVILTFHEVTRLKQLEKMRKEFVANVSHELRTPLTLIKGFAETLLDGAVDDPASAKKFLGTIQRHADRLSLIIDDLLTISQLESGTVLLEKQSLRLQPLVQHVLADLQASAGARGVALVNEVKEGTVVCADLQRTQQVLTNLIDNAIKYGREKGRVTVSALEQKDGMVQMTVADDGPGIPESELERVFERFYRVDKARSREQGGTGLGLSIVKHIVQSHGGRVWLESMLEKGSRFHFTLPAEPND